MVDDVNVEQILSEINSNDGSSEIPMSAPNPAPSQAVQEYEYTALGKTIKEPIEMILKRASQGYDYAQKMQEFNKQRVEFETKYKSYSEVDEYASKNPEWWNHVMQSYQDKFNNAQTQQMQSNLSPELAPLVSELQEVKNFITEQRVKEQQQLREAEDAKLASEVDEIRKIYPNLDLSAMDDSGKTLEVRILEHGVKNDIKSFKTAFRDFYHDELVKRAKEEGLEAAKKDLQKKSKLGLLGESSTPTKQLRQASNIKNRSYSDLLSEAMDELGIQTNTLRS